MEEVPDFLPSATKKTPLQKNAFSFDPAEVPERKEPLECSVVNETLASAKEEPRRQTFSPEQIQSFLYNFGALNAEKVSHLQRTVSELPTPQTAFLPAERDTKKAKTGFSEQGSPGSSQISIIKFVKESLNKITAENFDVISALLLSRVRGEQEAEVLLDQAIQKSFGELMFSECYVRLINLCLQKDPDVRTVLEERISRLVFQGYREDIETFQQCFSAINLMEGEEEREEQKLKKKQAFIGKLHFIHNLFSFQILDKLKYVELIIFGIQFYVDNFSNPGLLEEVREVIFEGLIKIFEYSGKSLKKLKKKKRKKKIVFKLEEELASNAVEHLQLNQPFILSFPDKINFNICEFFF